MRHHDVVWTPSLHPRDLRGRFRSTKAAHAARRDARSASSPEAQRQRRALQRKASLRLARGVAVGGATAALGHATGDKRYLAAGIGRVGMAAAEGQHNLRAARRTTSNGFSRLSAADQHAELARARRRSAQYHAAGLTSDVALSYTAGKRARTTVATHRANRTADANFTYMRTQTARKAAATRESAKFYQLKRKRATVPKYTNYQGPVPSRAKSAGAKGATKGAYNITSGTIKRTAPGKAPSNFAQRAAARAAKSPRVQRAAANTAVKVALAGQRHVNGKR